MMEEHSVEEYLLLLLSDANLPTGSFVASSGLESSIKHGFFSPSHNQATSVLKSPSASVSPPLLTKATINFVRDSLIAYANTSLPFIRAVYDVLEGAEASSESEVSHLAKLLRLDSLYESITLNQVARRASNAQGVALLSLYTKGFSKPPWMTIGQDPSPDMDKTGAFSTEKYAEEFKVQIRKGTTHGHLPICWGILTSTLGLKREKSQMLHLFLHSRALLSASIRLNTLGPYAAQQLLLHIVNPLVNDAVEQCKDLKIRWKEGSDGQDAELEEDEGPANTWPLGELLAGRHDLQHSRIFNS